MSPPESITPSGLIFRIPTTAAISPRQKKVLCARCSGTAGGSRPCTHQSGEAAHPGGGTDSAGRTLSGAAAHQRFLPIPYPVQGAGAKADPAAKPWPEDQRYGCVLLPDGRARPAGGAGGGVWGIAAGSRQTASGGFALKPHGDFYLN